MRRKSRIGTIYRLNEGVKEYQSAKYDDGLQIFRYFTGRYLPDRYQCNLLYRS